MIFILNLKLLAENGDCKFKAYGNSIDGSYNGKYMPGDKWRVELCDGEFLKIRLDSTLAESIIYVPDGVLSFLSRSVMKDRRATHPKHLRVTHTE